MSKFEYIWKFLRENNCDDGAGTVPEDVLCTICGKIMINAHSGRCGCRYCLGCVTQYLHEKEKRCPGKTDECKEELLNDYTTVHPDNAANQKIARLIVKCPQDRCEFKGELKNMEEHERMCKKKPIDCPYSPVGCHEGRLVSDKIDLHLVRANERHARMLMECVGVLQNENGSMRRDFETLTTELREMRQELQALKEENYSLKLKFEENRTEYVTMETNREQQLQEIKLQGQQRTQELQQLAEMQHQSDARFGTFQWTDRNEKDEQWRQINEGRAKQANCDAMATRVWAVATAVEQCRTRELVWCIDQWAAWVKSARYRVADKDVFSDAFYSHENGYRMCLSARVAHHRLTVSWHLMRGPFDDILVWPFEGDAFLSIIDQDTRLDHSYHRISSLNSPTDPAWMRPTSDMNVGSRIDEPVDLGEFARTPSAFRNDRVFIRCIVERYS